MRVRTWAMMVLIVLAAGRAEAGLFGLFSRGKSQPRPVSPILDRRARDDHKQGRKSIHPKKFNSPSWGAAWRQTFRFGPVNTPHYNKVK